MLLKFSSKGEIEEVDIQFVPEDPIVRERMPQRMHFESYMLPMKAGRADEATVRN